MSIVHQMDDKLSIRRRLLRAAQAPDCRLELIADAAKLAACRFMVRRIARAATC